MERWKGTESSRFRDDFRDDFREASHHSIQSSHSPPNFQRFLSQTLPPHSVPNSVSHSVPSGIVHWLLQGSRNEGTTITTPPPSPPASGTTVVEPFQSELLRRGPTLAPTPTSTPNEMAGRGEWNVKGS
ncbi:hypothetical protein HZH66_003064 [Vespula vulgaris]|uniref:Uncharacterized protein n=1 Tax=Vespula vulgaris TaxID=7454 RepID=A0A834NGK5_VESVU|nr:hypothetical protein HZH66_003064 [Vespula vulgaris]